MLQTLRNTGGSISSNSVFSFHNPSPYAITTAYVCVRMCAHMYAEPITLVLIINDRQCNEVP